MHNRTLSFIVGLFIIAAFFSLMFLAYRVSDITPLSQAQTYKVTAEFDNIGGLKIRAPVAIAGVKVGDVFAITLNPKNYQARVTLRLNRQFNNIPVDTVASIHTQGILGSNYISLSPGFSMKNLKNNGVIETTHSALVLENLIAQLVYGRQGDQKK